MASPCGLGFSRYVVWVLRGNTQEGTQVEAARLLITYTQRYKDITFCYIIRFLLMLKFYDFLT